jgi:hypothetical protein
MPPYINISCYAQSYHNNLFHEGFAKCVRCAQQIKRYLNNQLLNSTVLKSGSYHLKKSSNLKDLATSRVQI